jgi:hypothetical protein
MKSRTSLFVPSFFSSVGSPSLLSPIPHRFAARAGFFILHLLLAVVGIRLGAGLVPEAQRL